MMKGKNKMTIMIFAISVILEILFRYLRLPFFPVYMPLLFIAFHNLYKEFTIHVTLYVLILSAFLYKIYGLGFVELGLAFITTFYLQLFVHEFSATKMNKNKILTICITTLLWTVISLLFGTLPTGSISFESFFTAVLSRIMLNEYLAGIISRLLLIMLTYLLFYGLLSFIQKIKFLTISKESLLLIFLLSFSNCLDPKKNTINKNKAIEKQIESDSIISFFGDKKQSEFEHVILMEQYRNKTTCVGCHIDKITKSDLPLNQKNFHEIHFVFEKIEKDCTYCHENAGKKGFPNLLGVGDRRNEYNKKCISCHKGTVSDTITRLKWLNKYK